MVRLEQDSYYRDRSDLTTEERSQINYDHPGSLDNTLLVEHIQCLLRGESIEKPVYDFATHQRTAGTELVAPARVLLVDGILVLENRALRGLMDLKLFVDTDADVRFIRRLRRDLRERERTLESVVEQYLSTVRPMHQQFVEPSKRYADVIIPEGGLNGVATDMVISRLRALLSSPFLVPKSGPPVE